AREARPEREALRDPDEERAHDARFLGAGDDGGRPEPLDEDDADRPDDEGGGHGAWAEEMLLDPVGRDESEDGGGNEGDGDADREAARGGHDANKALPVLDDDGEHRSELNEDREDLGAVPFESEQMVRQEQMAGRGDGQELGNSLDDAEDDRDERQR